MLAKTPPMGWNSWDCYGASVTEDTVRKNAEYMAQHLHTFGWEYIVVDIQWYQPTATTHEYVPFADLCMDEFGRLQPAVNRFPSAKDGQGFKPLADYVHSLGLKFGIHIMRGLPRMAAHRHLPIKDSTIRCDEAALSNSVCMWNPDMYGLNCEEVNGTNPGQAYYDSIFRMYAEWGVDFVKCDDIAREYPHCEKEIETISHACRTCGRDIVLSLSPGAAPLEKAEHLKTYANMWRVSDDFWDEWSQLLAAFGYAEKWCIHSGPGHWPDEDMLPIGALRQDYKPDDWSKFTVPELYTMMTLWCMMRSPLMIGGELTKMDETCLKLLTNHEVLAIEKTTSGAHPLYRNEKECIWVTHEISGSAIYVALFNLSDEERSVTLDPDCIEKADFTVRELWTGTSSTCVSSVLPPHGASVWRIE
ncbi:MAG: glycoside hydrolase family 27 protein [Clostridia bacterium]|nr:glycoside hydrolase family 27 protein [Clostridia bacterium]